MAVSGRKIKTQVTVRPVEVELKSEIRLGDFTTNIVGKSPKSAKAEKITTTAQDAEGWSSFFNDLHTFSSIETNWNATKQTFDGMIKLSTSGVQLDNLIGNVKFLSIMNMNVNGEDVILSLDGDSADDYLLKISPGAMFNSIFNPSVDAVSVADLYVKTASGTEFIKYVIAK